MANLNFKYGLLNKLPEALSEGTIYVTTDERAMYIDLWAGDTDNKGNQVTEQKEVNGEMQDVPVGKLKRVRLGDFITYPTLTDLFKDTRNWDEHCLVYVEEGNILAKYKKSQNDIFPQYNPDTGEPKVDAEGKPVLGKNGWIRINNSDELAQNLAGLTATVGVLSKAFEDYSNGTNQTLTNLNEAIKTEQQVRADAIKGEQDARAAAIKGEQDARAAAIAKEQNDRAAAIATVNAEIASVASDLAVETANRISAISSLQQEMDGKMKAANAMSFKGVLNECYAEGEGESFKYILKTQETNICAGDTYKVGSAFYCYIEDIQTSIDKNIYPIYIKVQSGEVNGEITYEYIRVFTGDLVIALSDQEFTEEGETEKVIKWVDYKHHWTHISTGYEDDYNAKLIQIPGGNTIGFGLAGGAGEDRGSVSFSSDNLTIKQNPQVVDGITVNDINITLQWSTF